MTDFDPNGAALLVGWSVMQISVPKLSFAATSHLYNCVLLVMLMSPYSHLQARDTEIRKTGPSVNWVYNNFFSPYMLRVLYKRRYALTLQMPS